jgi:ribonuclease D
MRPYEFIDTAAGLDRLLDFLHSCDLIAVDTEADSLHVYFDKVCLFQFTAGDRDFIVDPLRCKGIEKLGEIFADPGKEKVFHAAEYDVLCLRRDYGFEFRSLFDTMSASLLLGYERIGLADLLLHHFGVELDKRFQRAHWAQRPLSEPMLEYARLDTHYLLDLRRIMKAELEAAGRLGWAHEEFDLIADRAWPKREFDPDGFWRIKGAGRLKGRALGILRQLYLLRDARARDLDRPPFKVLGNQTLLAIAETAPRNEAELSRVGGVSTLVARRMGSELLEAVRTGNQEEPPRRPRPSSNGQPYDPNLKARVKKLKEWRKSTAEPYGFQPHVLIPNAVIDGVAQECPVTLAQLAAMPEMRRWMLLEVGEALVTASKQFAS